MALESYLVLDPMEIEGRKDAGKMSGDKALPETAAADVGAEANMPK